MRLRRLSDFAAPDPARLRRSVEWYLQEKMSEMMTQTKSAPNSTTGPRCSKFATPFATVSTANDRTEIETFAATGAEASTVTVTSKRVEDRLVTAELARRPLPRLIAMPLVLKPVTGSEKVTAKIIAPMFVAAR